jgi:glycosyltransferase involved in cell wall biosynthesis
LKILFDTAGIPFHLAHGGAKTQILSTVDGLREIGVEVEFARWWDPGQTGDLIHTFGTPNRTYLAFARKKGTPVVNTTLFTGACNRPDWRLSLQGACISALMRAPGIPPLGMVRSQFKWDSYKACARNIVGLEAEVEVLARCYGVDRRQIRVVPLGLAGPFLNAGPGTREADHLINTGTITERKGQLELARLAQDTGVPVCFVGKPYDRDDAYWKQFEAMIDGKTVKHVSHTESVEEMIRLLQASRGFVLYSDRENWCLSAHEAAACGLPLLLPDQRWSRERFGASASYFSPGNLRQNKEALRHFHEAAPSMEAPPIRHHSWKEVADSLLGIYGELLGESHSHARAIS